MILLLFILIIAITLIVLVKNKVQGKKFALIVGAVIVICGLIYGGLIFKFSNNSISPNWQIMAERSGIDGWSNKVYFYSDGKVIVDNSVNKYTSKLDEKINLDEVYNYIKSNGSTEYIEGYKIILNKNSKETRYISNSDEKLEKFVEQINRGMIMKYYCSEDFYIQNKRLKFISINML